MQIAKKMVEIVVEDGTWGLPSDEESLNGESSGDDESESVLNSSSSKIEKVQVEIYFKVDFSQPMFATNADVYIIDKGGNLE